MNKRDELERAISVLEMQRTTLGDVAINAAIAGIRAQLKTLEPVSASQDQRKQITVLFADVSGFTAMSETMDAEDVQATMNALWKSVDAAITGHNGRIDKHIGDAVMALWGADSAREDDPEQAVRAALAMQEAVRAFAKEHSVPLRMRIGLNTGPALLGEVGTTAEFTAMGDTVNTASRLEHAAPIGGILISHDSYQHVRGVFEVTQQEPLSVKGKKEPLQVYQVMGIKPRAFRGRRRGVEGIETQMFGREAEQTFLQTCYQQMVQHKSRQVVTINADAGVGKSRLLFEFESWVDLQPANVQIWRGRARPDTQHLPYGLLRSLFAFRYQIQEDDSIHEVRRKLTSGIMSVLSADEHLEMKAHFVGQLLGYDFSHSIHLENAIDEPRQLRDRALMYMVEFFRYAGKDTPLLILLEDLHWADDSSLNALQRLGRAIEKQPILIVGAARPSLFERRPTWVTDDEFHFELILKPLSISGSQHLVEALLSKLGDVPKSLSELIVLHAEGNPFYIEELIKMLIEDGIIVKDEPVWYVQETQLAKMRVPATLTGVLQARLDSLPSLERALLQQAAVVGRTFWDRILQHLNQGQKPVVPIPQIPSALTQLVEREMVFRQPSAAFTDAVEHIFKHAMLREVTYESVLRRLRSQYHALIAEWLIENTTYRRSEYLGLIAEHFELAGRRGQALEYFRQAGEKASANYASAEAVTYFDRALTQLPNNQLEERFELLIQRQRLLGYMGDRTQQAADLEKLKAIAIRLEDDEKLVHIYNAEAVYLRETSGFPKGIEAAEKAALLALKVKRPDLEARARFELGRMHVYRKSLDEGKEQLEKALRLIEGDTYLQLKADILRNLGNHEIERGDFDKAGAYLVKALSTHIEARDVVGEATALNSLGALSTRQSKYEDAQTHLEQACTKAREIGYHRLEGIALNNLGHMLIILGDYIAAQNVLHQALDIRREAGDIGGWCTVLIMLGHVSRDIGQLSASAGYYTDAMEIARSNEFAEETNWAGRNLAHVLNLMGDHQAAVSQALAALELSREKGLGRQHTDIPHAVLSRAYLDMGMFGDAQFHRSQILENENRRKSTEPALYQNLWLRLQCGWVEQWLGELDTAGIHYDVALTSMESFDYPDIHGQILATHALLAHHRGDETAALDYASRALEHAFKRENTVYEAVAQLYLGHALSAEEAYGDATAAYKRCWELREQLEQAHLVSEPQAGLARIALGQDNSKMALSLIEPILNDLQTNELTGVDEPGRILLTCYQVLKANNDSRTNSILELAYDFLQRRASTIQGKAYVTSFWDNIAAHHQIRELWQVARNANPVDDEGN